MDIKPHRNVTADTLNWLEDQLEEIASGNANFDIDEARELLVDWKPALVGMTHGRLMRWLGRKGLNTLDGNEMYQEMTPDELVAATNANADALEEVAEQRVREHLFVKNLASTVSNGLSGMLLNLLTSVII